MIKLIAFDVDGTLAKLNTNITQKDSILLRKIYDKGVKIMILSGKPTSYLAGFTRQIGRKNIIISGENGINVHFGCEFPPSESYTYPLTQNQLDTLERIKKEVKELNGNFFFQPNLISVTPFFLDEESKELLFNYSKKIKESQKEIDVYFHSDCVDFTPKNVSKGNSLKYVLDKHNIKQDEFITVGDGENDIPMLEISNQRYIIGNKISIDKGVHFKTLNEALAKILTKL